MLIVYSRFLLNKGNTSSTARVLGRPQDKGMLYWFQMLCWWLESEADAELYTLTELHAKMVEVSGGSDVYSPKRLKQKFQEYFLRKLRGVVLYYALEIMASYNYCQ